MVLKLFGIGVVPIFDLQEPTTIFGPFCVRFLDPSSESTVERDSPAEHKEKDEH